ncbi:MAG TPA: hypothetical protein VJ755_12650 [Gemmatimonadales bacterium]|nr:hypothetical protein [Gemmatimonadales bacterium]
MILMALLMVVAQAPGEDPRYQRLDPETRARVGAIVDSARGAGLPSEPIIQRALEGSMKNAGGDRIVAAVRRLAADLGTARDALGSKATTPELDAGVAALRAGATPATLTRLRDVRKPPITMALAVLADLVASGVPADSATAALLVLAPTVRDADLVEFRRAVERDIALGAPPASATSVRAMGTAGTAELNATGRNAQPGKP